MTETDFPIMPDFASPRHGFHHTVNSAVETLAALGITANRITIRTAGMGLPADRVVEQKPSWGATLGRDTDVALTVSGLGFFNALPVGLREQGGEEEAGTREIVSLLDDPLQKAVHWARQGGRIFDIQPDNLLACGRWINLFGIDPEDWPSENWYNLAVLLPSLHRLAGTEKGIRCALQLILGLPLAEIRKAPAFCLMDTPSLSTLGEKFSRLGVDWVVGDRLEGAEGLTLVVGPVPLRVRKHYCGAEGQRRLNAVLALCTPTYEQCAVSWVVLDPYEAPRLGCEEENSVLGVNSYLGESVHAAF